MSASALHVDVDNVLNPYLPPPPWPHLPRAISHFFGHRHPDRPQKPIGNVIVAFWSFIGVFSGLSIIEGVGMNIPSFQDHNAPLIVASFVSLSLCHFVDLDILILLGSRCRSRILRY